MNRSDGSTADYYVLPDGATQLQDLISHRNMNAQIGEIIRACYRYGMASHSDMLRDAKKIRFYAQSEVERLEKIEAASEQCGQVDGDLFKDAPEWAQYLVNDSYGACWFEKEPVFDSLHNKYHSPDGQGGIMKAINGDSVSPARIYKRPQ